MASDVSPERIAGALAELLPAYLPRQRWYSGPDELAAGGPRVVSVRELCTTGEGTRHLHQAIVEAGGGRYQLLVGERPAGEPAEFLNGHEEAVVGGIDGSYLYDATLDPELARELLPIVTGGVEAATRVRPVSAEQSNTSLVFDDRIILKVFRRLHEGRNPDVEVTTKLARVGFEHVARPVGSWRERGIDLAFAQEFLAGGSEGWALALTSLRDFYNSARDDPAEAGGDFSMEANRLGRVTAQLHAALAEAFGAGPLDAGAWGALVDDVARRLAGWSASVVEASVDDAGAPGVTAPDASGLLARLRAVTELGVGLRVHGDYHLGQVMRADSGWYVLDFEGEPARPLDQRVRPASALKDVAGMLRSFDYAARFGLTERGTGTDLGAKADAWVEHNRSAFVEGFLAEEAVQHLLPPAGSWDAVLAAYELDKALYELDYERAYRPTWVAIPSQAIGRIVERLNG